MGASSRSDKARAMSEFSDKLRGVDVTYTDDISVICNAADEIDRLVAMLETQDKQMTAQSSEGKMLREAIAVLDNHEYCPHCDHHIESGHDRECPVALVSEGRGPDEKGQTAHES